MKCENKNDEARITFRAKKVYIKSTTFKIYLDCTADSGSILNNLVNGVKSVKRLLSCLTKLHFFRALDR